MSNRVVEETQMNVKCIKSSKSSSIILNKVYICTYVSDRHWGQASNWKISLLGLSNDFPLENFTKEDGTPIPKIRQSYVPVTNYIDRKEITKGDIYVCNSKHLKTLTYGKFYHVDKIKGDNWNIKFSVKEIKNSRYYSPSNFKKIPTENLREMEIDGLLGSSTEMEEKTSDYDKITHLNNLEKIELIAGSLMDAVDYKNKTKVKDTSLFEIIKQRKIGKSSLTEEDFDLLSTINWDDFLNEI